MKIGVSTASLYPMHTEDALLELARRGVKNIEIFLSSATELKGEIFSSVRNTVEQYRLNVISLHPFSSPMETLFLFSSYDRRVNELMDLYKSFFEAMNLLCPQNQKKIFVIHGAIASAKCSYEKYVKRMSELIDAGRQAGITVAQENVSYCMSGKLDFLENLSNDLGDSAAFVLDVKQAKRSGLHPFEILEILGNKIIHLHLSDSDESNDCLPVGAGKFDFTGFFSRLKKIGYGGGAVVELYRDNYSEYSELSKSVEILEKIEENACN